MDDGEGDYDDEEESPQMDYQEEEYGESFYNR